VPNPTVAAVASAAVATAAPERQLGDVFADLARLAVLLVPACESASITVDAGARRYSAAATSELSVAFDEEQLRSSAGPGLEALATGEPVVVADVAGDDRWPGLSPLGAAPVRSVLCVPVPHAHAVRASLNLYATAPDAFGRDDIAAVTIVARQAALSLDYLSGPLAERTATADDQQIAAVVQKCLLPALPEIPALRMAARYAPGDVASVGGDWYDVVELRDGAIGVMIGDVMGHGVAAAVGMGQLRSAFRAYAWELSGPALVLDRVDDLMQGLDMGPLATALYARLVLDGDHVMLRYAAAGHPPPLVIGPDGATWFLELGRSSVLGAPLPPGTTRAEATEFLPGGSTLLLYTDGLVEHRRRSLDDGLSLLARVAGDSTGDESPDALCDRLLAVLGDGEPEDDIAVLAIHVKDAATAGP
jgi:serine phosphatase RsbU (regulator of sigma subunit)